MPHTGAIKGSKVVRGLSLIHLEGPHKHPCRSTGAQGRSRCDDAQLFRVWALHMCVAVAVLRSGKACKYVNKFCCGWNEKESKPDVTWEVQHVILYTALQYLCFKDCVLHPQSLL